MPRPKSNRLVGVKMPDVLEADIVRQVAMWNTAVRVRRPHAPVKTKSDWIKESCEWRLTLIKGLGIGYYALRAFFEERQSKSGCTKV